MRSTRTSRAPRGSTGARFALGTAALLGLLVAQVIGGTAGAGAEPEAAKSAKVTKQLKQLKKRVAALEAAPTAADGELGGSYPNPTVDDELGFTRLSIDGPCPGGHTGNCPGAWDSNELTMTRKDGSPTEITYVGHYNGQAVYFEDPGGVSVFLSGSGFMQMREAASFLNPPVNVVSIHARDVGGQTELVARFNDGEVDVIAEDN